MSQFRSVLWFDVGVKRYTTRIPKKPEDLALWFDVGVKRYTTIEDITEFDIGCGLM